MKKYELTEETVVIGDKTLFRIRALRSFGDIKAGDLGGFIENERNLSHEENAWVGGNAQVVGNAWVGGNAKVGGCAWVGDEAWVIENAVIEGNAKVGGDALVCYDD